MTAETDSELATRLAVEAGRQLVDLRDELFSMGAAYWEVMDSGDALGHRFIADELRRHRPDDPVLDEEGREDPRRFGSDRVWIIDPLDGTREFGEPGRHDWAVHVALWEAGRFAAGAGVAPRSGPRVLDRPRPSLPDTGRTRRVITSRHRAPWQPCSLRTRSRRTPSGSAPPARKAMAVVLGEADLYVHDGGMYQWDSAAPAAVAQAAGLFTSRIDGTPLVYNDRDPWLPTC
ncbi:MAG: inositol monophosphatase family protein [Ilumatobacteraceae bacterium]